MANNDIPKDGDTIFGRMKEARLQAAVRRRETVSQERMGELVGEALGRSMAQTQWRRYETDREPPLDVIRAAATVSGLSEAYIAFGLTYDDLIDPARDRKLSPQEEQRALRVAEELQRHRKTPAETPPAKGRKRGAGGR